jgi:hypothetical protein
MDSITSNKTLLIVAGVVVVVGVGYLVYTHRVSWSEHFNTSVARKCGEGEPPCPPGDRCYVDPYNGGKGTCTGIAQKCGEGKPSCPVGHICGRYGTCVKPSQICGEGEPPCPPGDHCYVDPYNGGKGVCTG